MLHRGATAVALPLRTVYLARRTTRSFSNSAASHAPQRDSYDVVIVGGGPAGLSLAAALGSQSTSGDELNVALVESSDLSKVRNWSMDENTYSNRVSSITNASRQFLEDVGAWDHVDESRTAPIEHMEVWDGISDSRIIFNNSDIDPSLYEMARLTENLNLQRGLLRRLAEMPEQVELLDKVRVEGINREGSGSWPVVRLSDGAEVKARLLVGADGFNSPVRHFAGIDSYGWSYPTHAVVATLQQPSLSPSHDFTSSIFPRANTTAYQRFLPTGPIAFLPLSSTVSSLVWSTSPQLSTVLKAVQPTVLAALINAAFRLPDVSMRYLNTILLEHASNPSELSLEQILSEIQFREQSDGITHSSPLSSSDISSSLTGIPPTGSEAYPPLVENVQLGSQAGFPLKLSHADSYVDERIALVGDAAHTVHPLAGQGLNMGLADVKALSDVICETLNVGGDIGSYTSLMAYHQARYLPNHALLSVTDKLHKIYSLQSGPAVWARSVGIDVLNELGPLKGALMSGAGASSFSPIGNVRNEGTGASASPLWNFAANGIEVLDSTAKFGKVLAGATGATIQGALQNLLRSVAEKGRV